VTSESAQEPVRLLAARADTSGVSAFLYVVEDDDDLRRLLVRSLVEEGFDAEGVESGSRALLRQSERAADAFVLDIGLPDADGRDLCQALRAQGVRAPVLFLTARDAVPDRISGFRAGGDDYVTKPFALAEVAERLRALLRRAGDTQEEAPDSLGLRIDPATHSAVCAGESVALTPTEFRLLGALAGRPGQTLRRLELIRAAWPDGAIVSDNTLDVYIAKLRRKLRQLPAAPVIATAHGIGYALRE
jgi:two-component system OmpR family response regulator